MGSGKINSLSLLASKSSQLVSSRSNRRSYLQKKNEGEGKMAQQIEALAAKPEDPSLIPESHLVEREK